jgi:hypothetical protein
VVVSSSDCLQINLEERGCQPSLGTLAHLLSYVPFLFSLGFSIGRELHGETERGMNVEEAIV